jgi:putative transposase
MSRYRRSRTLGATYFFTINTYRRQRLLTDGEMLCALREALQRVRAKHPFRIDAMVVLPDHLHTIWTLPPSDAGYSTRLGLLKLA